MNEYYKMLFDPAHWAFEATVTLIIDGVLVGIFWPLIRNCWQAWKVAREIRERAAWDVRTMDLNLCGRCGTLPKRIDNSVDICMDCGGVQIPKRKRLIFPTREQYEAEKAAREERQRLCDHLHNGINLLARDGVCSKCMVMVEKNPV